MKINLKKKGIVLNILMLMIVTSLIPSIYGQSEYTNELLIINLSQSDDNIKITYEINNIEKNPINIEGDTYYTITINDEPNILIQGIPDIPVICRSIIIPDNAKMTINVIDTSYTDINNINIAPSKGNLLRNINPDDIDYTFDDDVYSNDEWYPDKICKLREPYILRDYRGQVVEVYPVQYNPIKKIMRTYTHIEITITPTGIDNINTLNREKLPEKIDTEFKNIYTNHFINYGKTNRYDPVAEQGNMLIICYDDFIDEMEPFVLWKTIQGIPTEIIPVTEIGGANAIKSYINDYYDEKGLTFVLLVGDAAQVPTLYSSGSASDPSYTYIIGYDHYPDLFVGRFSAQNSSQVFTQVQRSIEYEQNPQIDADWYHKGVGVASSSGPGDDGEYDDEHIDNIRDKLLAYTYTEVDQIYAPNATTQKIVDAINNGRSIINYCGHGTISSWTTGDFKVQDVNELKNDDNLPFVISLACNNGEFDNVNACFCEAWLRATNNSKPTGGIAATGSSIEMSWMAPMDGQDEMIDLIVESYEKNIKLTIGGIHYNGVMHMMDEYGQQAFLDTDTWIVFGDPSLQIRTDTPIEISVIHENEIKEYATSFEVIVKNAENASCTISRNGQVLGHEFINQSGYAIINFNETIIGEEPLKLVITAFNKIPYIKEIPIGLNKPPHKPTKPIGPTKGKTGITLTYSTNTSDPEGNQVFYMWDWGDGNQSIWMGPYNSDQIIYASWNWTEKKIYEVKVKSKDSHDYESEWSDSLNVSMPRLKNIDNLILRGLFDRVINIFLKLKKLIFNS